MFLFVKRIDVTEHTHKVTVYISTRNYDSRTSFRVFIDVHLVYTSVVVSHIDEVTIHACDVFVELFRVLCQLLKRIEYIGRTLLHFHHISYSRHGNLQFQQCFISRALTEECLDIASEHIICICTYIRPLIVMPV